MHSLVVNAVIACIAKQKFSFHFIALPTPSPFTPATHASVVRAVMLSMVRNFQVYIYLSSFHFTVNFLLNHKNSFLLNLRSGLP